MIDIIKARSYFDDLKRIDDFISDELNDPSLAKKTISEIELNLTRLSDFPMMGSPFSLNESVKTDYRYIVIDYYIVFYSYTDSHVYVLRAFNTKMDYHNIIMTFLNKPISEDNAHNDEE